MLQFNFRARVLLACFGLASTQCIAHARSNQAERPSQFERASGAERALAPLNRHARAVYAKARDAVTSHADPVLIAHFDRLVLVHNGRREVLPYAPDQALGLKDVAHAALAAWTLLDRIAEDPAAWAPVAAAFALDVQKTAPALRDCGFTPGELQNQQKIMADVQKSLERAVVNPKAAEAQAFAGRVKPLLDENVAAAAQTLLDNLNTQMHALKAKLGPETFAALHVVVPGGHMARRDERTAQYFQQLFGGEAEGNRWVWTECAGSDDDALGALGMHLLDAGVGSAFYGEAMRMHRDVMADAAREHLATMQLPAL